MAKTAEEKFDAIFGGDGGGDGAPSSPESKKTISIGRLARPRDPLEKVADKKVRQSVFIYYIITHTN